MMFPLFHVTQEEFKERSKMQSTKRPWLILASLIGVCRPDGSYPAQNTGFQSGSDFYFHSKVITEVETLPGGR